VTEGINVGSVYADVLPDARQFNTKLAEIARNAAIAVKVDADTRAAEARIAALDGGDVTVRANLDDEEAGIRLDELTRTREAKINVDADTAGAEANIARLNQSASGAGTGLGAMATAALTLGPALVPLGAAALGAAAGFAALGAAGLAGAGVLAVGLAGVTSAVKLLGQQQTQQQAAGVSAASSAASQAQAIRSAQQQITSAQYAMTQADQQEKTAVQALVTAREAAARQLESYANQAVDTVLAQKQAAIDLQTAQANYNTTMASSTATDLQKQQAALDLSKAQQGLTEAQQAATNASQDNAKAQKAGVDGAPQVLAAQKQIADAQHNQQQATQQLANATQALAAAQAKSAGSTNAALAATNAQIAKLDPATRSFAEYIRGTLTPVWHQLTGTIAAGLFPGMQAGIQAMMPDLPILTRFLGNLSQAMGDLFQSAGKALASPFWQNFFNMLADNIGPWMTALGHILGDLVTGFAGLFQAMVPIANMVIPWLEMLAQKFANFGASASSNAGFQKVIEYIKENLPAVGHLLGGVVTAVGHIIEALAPIGPPILALLNGIIGLLNRIPVHVLTAVAVGIGAIVAAQKIWNLVADANPIVLVLAGIAAAFTLVYAHSKTFRDFIASEVMPTLKEWGQWIADHIMPVLHDLWDFIGNHLVPLLSGIFMHVWHGIQDVVHAVSDAISGHRAELKQLWDVISGVIGFIVEHVLPVLGPILQGVFWLLGHAISVVIDIVSALIDMWNAMWQLGKDLGAWFSGPFVGFFVGVWDHIRDGWRNLVNDIKGLWQDIEHWVMDPVAWVVRFVINDGLIKAWDWISDHLLGGALHANPMNVPTVPPLAAANGAVVPGYAPGVDSVHAMLSPGEGVLVPEAVRGLGGAPAIHALNSAYSNRVPGGNGHFAGGGVVDSIISALVPGAGIAEAIGGQKMTAIIDDPLHAVQNLVKGLMGGIGKAGPFIDMLGQAVLGMAKGVGGALLQAIQGSSFAGLTGLSSRAALPNFSAIPGPMTGGLLPLLTGARSGIVQMAQQMAASVGWTGAEWNALNAVVMRESGWNPNAQNPTSTAYGIPQFLNSTWATVGLSKTSDPATQVTGLIRYIAGRYHDPLGALAHEQAFGWYDAGGLVPPGPSLVYNGTGQPELIAPQQTFKQIMSGASGGSAGPSQFTGNLYLDSGEFMGKVAGVVGEYADVGHNQAVFNG
jgi:phage-related protein